MPILKYILVAIILFITYKKVILPFADRMLEFTREEEEFEITDNKEHFTTSKDIEQFLKESKINISMKKFAMELKKYCSIKK